MKELNNKPEVADVCDKEKICCDSNGLSLIHI